MKCDSLGDFWLSKHLEKYQIPTDVDWLSWELPVRKPWTSYVHQYARKGSHAVTQLTYNIQGRNPEVPIPELTRLKSQTSRAKDDYLRLVFLSVTMACCEHCWPYKTVGSFSITRMHASRIHSVSLVPTWPFPMRTNSLYPLRFSIFCTCELPPTE